METVVKKLTKPFEKVTEEEIDALVRETIAEEIAKLSVKNLSGPQFDYDILSELIDSNPNHEQDFYRSISKVMSHRAKLRPNDKLTNFELAKLGAILAHNNVDGKECYQAIINTFEQSITRTVFDIANEIYSDPKVVQKFFNVLLDHYRDDNIRCNFEFLRDQTALLSPQFEETIKCYASGLKDIKSIAELEKALETDKPLECTVVLGQVLNHSKIDREYYQGLISTLRNRIANASVEIAGEIDVNAESVEKFFNALKEDYKDDSIQHMFNRGWDNPFLPLDKNLLENYERVFEDIKSIVFVEKLMKNSGTMPPKL